MPGQAQVDIPNAPLNEVNRANEAARAHAGGPPINFEAVFNRAGQAMQMFNMARNVQQFAAPLQVALGL